MKTKNIILIIILVLIAGSGGWLFSKKHQTGPSTHSSHKDIYYCPMHPQYTSDRPGNCPICGMKLVKKETGTSQSIAKPSTESSQEYATVSMNTQQQQLIGIKTAPVEKKMLTKTIRAYGYVAHDLELYEAQLEYIEAWQVYYSFVVRRPVKDEFRQDWWQYYAKEPSQSRWRSSEKRKAQERLVKAEYELRHMGFTDTQFEQLRKIKYGQPWVDPDLLFFHEGHPVWIYAQILENDLGFIDVGQKAIITIPAYQETTEGIVRNVDLMVNPDTRTTRVRIELPKYRGELKVNMYTDVEFPVEFDTLLVVPRQAVMDTGLSKIVFVQTSAGIFEPRPIQTGREGDAVVAVKSGLKEGEIIVVSGNFLLDSESRLQASLTGGHHHD